MTLEVFATGLVMGESPRWHDGRLWVCDWIAGQVLVFDPDGGRDVIARVEGLPFSLEWLPEGRMLLTTAQGLLVGRDGAHGSILTPYGDDRRAWNEIVVDPRGNIFVDMPGSMPGEASLPGTVGVITPDGTCREVAGEVWFPNGMAITPDGSTLILAESHGHRLTAWDIEDDGSLGGRRVWAELGEAAAPDGICLDAHGAIWYADVPNQHCRRVAEGGEILETVHVGQPGFACMLGGNDGRTLFIVANDWSAQGAANGRILTYRAPSPHAGRP